MRCFKVTVVHERRTYTFVSLDRVLWVWFGPPEHGFASDIERAASHWQFVRFDAFEHLRKVRGWEISNIVETTIHEKSPY
jgi:hypothetical protein